MLGSPCYKYQMDDRNLEDLGPEFREPARVGYGARVETGSRMEFLEQ